MFLQNKSPNSIFNVVFYTLRAEEYFHGFTATLAHIFGRLNVKKKSDKTSRKVSKAYDNTQNS